MADLIDRQAAIDAVRQHKVNVLGGGREWDAGIQYGYEAAHEHICDVLVGLPSAQPERKEGQWIRKSDWMWTCPFCGKDNAYAYSADDAYEPTVLQDFFCPNCGARMGGNGNADK